MHLRPIFLALLFLAGLASPAPAAPPAGVEQKLLIGLIPEMNIFEQKERFRLLGEYLSRKTGVPVQFTILSRYGNIISSFETEKMDGAFFGSFTGALAINRLGVVPLARPVNLDGTSTYQGYLFVRKDSGIRDASGMKGKRMAFVEKATTAGYVFPLAWLREQGIEDAGRFFRESFFTGSHDAAVMAVLNRKADVGAAKHSIYDRVRKKEPRVDAELAILAASPAVPSNGLCVRKGLAPALQAKLKDALLGLERDPAGKAVLGKFGALRFIETTASDYQPVLDMARKAGIDLKRYQYRND
jgi:phosphonate transport system substrate-binding protein